MAKDFFLAHSQPSDLSGSMGVMKQFVTECECYTIEPIRLTRLPSVYLNASLGISRGFAFVEFYHLQDATRWMETNQVAS